MSAPLWFILVIIPCFGYLIAAFYVIIREVRKPLEPEKTAHLHPERAVCPGRVRHCPI
jgi:hypothetical protein